MLIKSIPNNAFIPLNEKGISNGVATLDGSASIPLAQIPTTLTGKDADTLDGSHGSAFALLAGRNGGQTLKGGTGSAESLTLNSTSNATKGNIFLGASSVYNEETKRLGIQRLAVSHSVEISEYNNAYTNNSYPLAVFQDRSTIYQAARRTGISFFDTVNGNIQACQGAIVGVRENSSNDWYGSLAFLTSPFNGSSQDEYYLQERMRIYYNGNIGVGTTSPTISDGIGVHLNGKILRINTSKTPSSASATGNIGEICWDVGYLYVCVATNTWRRIAHNTW